MLFYYNVNTTHVEKGVLQKNIVFMIKDTKYHKSVELLCDTSLFDLINQNTPIRIAKLPEIMQPIVCTVNTTNAVDCTSFVVQLMAQLDKVKEITTKMKEIYLTALDNITKDREASINMLEAAYIHWQYINGSGFRFDNFGAMHFDNDFRKETANAFYIEETISVDTLFQDKCTDKLMFKLPLLSQLNDDEISIDSLLPLREQLCKPYPDGYEIAYTSDYKAPGRGIPSSMYLLVEGRVENNTLPIQENEREFYDTLTNWIKFNISTALKVKVDEMDAKLVTLDQDTEIYLTELLTRLYSWHWGHNKNVPAYLPEEDDVAEDSDASKFVFTLKNAADINNIIVATDSLIRFVRKAQNEIGIRAWVETVIKILRWGERKPTSLYFQGYPYIFELGTNRVLPYVGSITDYNLAVTPEGYNMTVDTAFIMDTRIRDTEYVSNKGYPYPSLVAPVGVVCKQIYINSKKADDRIAALKYFSITDFIMLLFSNKINEDTMYIPEGISVSEEGSINITNNLQCNRNLTTTKLLQNYNAEKNRLLTNPYYSNQVLNDLYMELKSNSAEKLITQLEILRTGIELDNIETTLEKNSIDSLEQLVDKCSQMIIYNKDQAIASNVFRQLYPVYIEVSKRLIEVSKSNAKLATDMTYTLNLFKEIMLELDYKSDNYFLSKSVNEVVSFRDLYNRSLSSVSNAQTLEESHAFSTIADKEQEAEKEFSLSEESVTKDATEKEPLENTELLTTEVNRAQHEELESDIENPADPERTEEVHLEQMSVALSTESKALTESSKKTEESSTINGVMKISKPSFIIESGNPTEIVAIVKERVIHGYMTVKSGNPDINGGKDYFVLLRPDYSKRVIGTNVKQAVPISSVIPLAMENLYLMQTNKLENCRLYFDSEYAMKYYTLKFREMV